MNISYALRRHTENDAFHPFEVHLRETYDTYFTELEKYYYYIKIGIFDVEFLRPYLGYYLDIQGGKPERNKRKLPDAIIPLHNYMATYFPINLTRFYKKFGYKIIYKKINNIPPAKYAEWLAEIDVKILAAQTVIQ